MRLTITTKDGQVIDQHDVIKIKEVSVDDVKDLCGYGSSPRHCFPHPAFKEQLPRLIAMWKHYSNVWWSTDVFS